MDKLLGAILTHTEVATGNKDLLLWIVKAHDAIWFIFVIVNSFGFLHRTLAFPAPLLGLSALIFFPIQEILQRFVIAVPDPNGLSDTVKVPPTRTLHQSHTARVDIINLSLASNATWELAVGVVEVARRRDADSELAVFFGALQKHRSGGCHGFLGAFP